MLARRISLLTAKTPANRLPLKMPALVRGNATKPKIPPTYKEDSTRGAMMRWEESLPKLPVPTLEETAARYLKSLKPLLNENEFSLSEKAVSQFLQNEGPELQKQLIARKEQSGMKNWLTEWWDYNAYMAYRDPVVINVSYFYAHKDDRSRRSQAGRAAALSTGALAFRKMVVDGSLEPEYMKGLPISMGSYKYMFNACRLPQPTTDYVKTYPFDASSEFILVMRKNRFYKVYHTIDGKQLSTADLEAQFKHILDHATPADISIGALTSENRDVWLEAREALLKNNRAALEDIEKSSFVVSLDTGSPATLEERARQFWHGDGQNRYYDKPLHFIVCENGVSGFLGEHSMMDGTPTHRLNDYVCHVLATKRLDHGSPVAQTSLPEPEEITFQTSPEIQRSVELAKRQFKEAIDPHDLRVCNYQGYGKGLIKKFKSSPDAYVQMIIQLAYFKMYGQCRPTYESAATRRFQDGRTETCRTVSEESVAWCQSMENPNASNQEMISKLRAAISAHGKYINDASAGKGVDRHLFGLKQLLPKGTELPAIYKDPAYAYSSKWFISSSQLSSEYFNGYGWGEVIPEGFGIAYMINVHSINFNIVSRHLGCDKMQYYLTEAANEMRDLLITELPNEKAKL